MTPKRFFYVMSGVVALLCVLIIGSVFVGKNLIDTQSKKLVELKAQNKVIEEQQVSLVQAKKDIEKYSDLNKIAQSIVPQDKDQAKTIRELTKIASETGIDLKAITFQSSNLGQAVPKAAPPTEDSAAPAPVAQPTISQVKPVEGIKGVLGFEIMISPVDERPVPYKDFLAFLEKLESNRRTAHVSKLTINPTEDARALTFVLTLNAYVKP